MSAPGRTVAGIGSLRRRLTLEAPVDTPDGAGGVSRSWQATAALWGAVELGEARERYDADRLNQSLTWRVTLRWRAGLDAGMRFRLETDRLLLIHAVADPDGSRRRLVCIAEEIRS